MAPPAVTTMTVPAIVYATALLSDAQVVTRSHNDEFDACSMLTIGVDIVAGFVDSPDDTNTIKINQDLMNATKG